MPKKEDYVTVCPKCGSDNVSFEKEAAYVATGLSNQYKECNNCGYHGLIFPEAPRSQVTEKPKDIKEVKKVELVQTSFGKGYFKYLLYIAVPILIIILLLLIFR